MVGDAQATFVPPLTRASYAPCRRAQLWTKVLGFSRMLIYFAVIVVAAIMGWTSFRQQVAGQIAAVSTRVMSL